MLDVLSLCGVAIRFVYWLVMLGCNFLGYSPLWAKRGLKNKEINSTAAVRSKTPPHLAILFSSRNIKHDQILVLMKNCLESGVRTLSLYDPWNDVVALENKLLPVCKMKGIRLLVGSVRESVGRDASMAARLTVILLKAESGKRSLVDICKQLSSSDQPVTVPIVSERLASAHQITEPDLVIHVGDVPSLCGYPPWSLRVSEIVLLSQPPLSRPAFEHCLDVYSRRDIRLGK